MPCGVCAANTVVGEHRNDAPAHHRHDEHDEVEPNLQARDRGPVQDPKIGKMDSERDEADQQQNRDEKVVSGVAAPGERNSDRDRDRHGKRGIHDCRSAVIGRQHQDSAGDPQQRKRGQRRAGRRRLSGPVADRSEEEAGDDGERVAEQHLVGMPDRTARESGGKNARVLANPQRNRQRGKYGGEEVKRPEAKVPERKRRPCGIDRQNGLLDQQRLRRHEKLRGSPCMSNAE